MGINERWKFPEHQIDKKETKRREKTNNQPREKKVNAGQQIGAQTRAQQL